MTWLRAAGLRLVLAIGLGFSLWVFVSFTTNPDRRIPFESLPVNVEGLSPGLILVDENGLPTTLPNVSVTVEGDAETLRNIRPNDVHPFVDLSDTPAGQHVVEVEVAPNRTGPQRVTFLVEPDFLPIRLEEEITSTVPLTVHVSGNVPFSFEAGKPRVRSGGQPIETVQVRGPQSRVERVAVVRATADIDRLTANYNSPRPLEPLGPDGQEIDGVTITPPTIDVLVPIISSAGIKRVPIVPTVVGRPASGYIVTDILVEPQFVNLTGSSGPLDTISSISTLPVDVDNANQTITRTVALQEPSITSVSISEPVEVVVTVRIEPIARPFQLTLPVPVQIVGVEAGLLYSVSPQNVQVTLTGTANQLAALDPARLLGTVNARGLNPGTYSLAPTFNLPEGISLVGEPRVNVSVRQPPAPTQAPVPTANNTATPVDAATPETAEPTEAPTEAPTLAPTEAPAAPTTEVPATVTP